jgi:hypothetical protein
MEAWARVPEAEAKIKAYEAQQAEAAKLAEAPTPSGASPRAWKQEVLSFSEAPNAESESVVDDGYWKKEKYPIDKRRLFQLILGGLIISFVLWKIIEPHIYPIWESPFEPTPFYCPSISRGEENELMTIILLPNNEAIFHHTIKSTNEDRIALVKIHGKVGIHIYKKYWKVSDYSNTRLGLSYIFGGTPVNFSFNIIASSSIGEMTGKGKATEWDRYIPNGGYWGGMIIIEDKELDLSSFRDLEYPLDEFHDCERGELEPENAHKIIELRNNLLDQKKED